MDSRSSLTPPAKARPSTSSSSIASAKSPSVPQQSSAMASSSRTGRGTTPTGNRPSTKAAEGDKPTRPPSKDSLKQKATRKPEEGSKPSQAEEQLRALKSDFEGLRSHLTCKICDRLLYQPYTISCGHTYCYSCLCTWFVANKARKTCPDCRAVVTQPPAPAYVIREMACVFISRTELLPAGETAEQHAQWQKEEADAVQQDKDSQDPRTGGLFKGCFRPSRHHAPSVRAIRDQEDGVDRCPMCNWELEDGGCEQCGLFFDENGELTWGDSFAGFSDMDEMSEHDMSSEDLDMDLEDYDGGYDEALDGWHGDEGSFMMQRFLEHGINPYAAQRFQRRMHSDAGSRRSYSQSIISDMYTDEMDTVEEEDEEEMDGDSSMNDFIDDDDEPASNTSRSTSSAASVTPQPPSNRARLQGRAQRVVESEASSTISSAIAEEDEDEEDQGPIRRGRRNPAQTRILNRANGLRSPTVGTSSTSTDASGEQELDEDTQALLQAEGWMLQHDGPDEEMDENELSDGAQTTVGWDATAISNDRLRMGGSLTPTADRPQPNAPIRPPSRVGNPRFLDASRGLRRRSSILSTSSVHMEDGEADDDNSDLDNDGDIAMAMNSLRNRRSRIHLRNSTALNSNNTANRSLNRGVSSNNPIDLDTDDNSDTSQPGRHRTTPHIRPRAYDSRISWMFANHQRILQEVERPGLLVDVEHRSTTPVARPRTSNRNRPSPAQQFSPFPPPAPARLRTPLMDISSNPGVPSRVPTSPAQRAVNSPASPGAASNQSAATADRASSIGSTSNASSTLFTPGSTTPNSQRSINATSQAQAAAAIDMIERPPSRVGPRPPSAAGRRTPAGYSPVYPVFPHANVGLNIQGRILQNQRMGNPWGAFVQPHGVRARTSRPVLRDQSSTATLRPAMSRANMRDGLSQTQGMRTQASRIDLRHQPSRRRLSTQASTRTLRASEHARPPQTAGNTAPSPNHSVPRPTRFTPDERESLARELINTRMRALGGAQEASANPSRTNPFAPGFRRPNAAAGLPSAAPSSGNPQHIRSNSSGSVNSGVSATTTQATPVSPALGRRRSNRNINTAPPPALSPAQAAFSPPATTYTSTYFRARQGSYSGSSATYESSINTSTTSPMVAAAGPLI
ncbi:uncharacterized protein EI97DRAFT_490964 [Westerdykella ornata]|uniref:RING-type domain-containing protein n=1 Tax=Westerdykella ornata TaxID=318751 RepID=A0A6A6JXB4_WESOR|nr:uncharacterized protein EI97DRAFT_490964 [Westerdykella ornata]KAF2280865.1 hypothetical protein EI97DRAFT_490964 [Westerdykella ornata]